ncbi:MAG: argininosuccinate synthase, partial [bacterium]|nr:argininosuccinate synthase [bacterium]
VMLKWIQDHYDAELYTVTIDIGQKADDLEAVKQKALKLGAKGAYVVDAKKEYADTQLREAILANADYQGGYHLFCPLGRVIISKVGVDIAHKVGAEVIAHGSTGKGNDQVRFESYVTTLDPKMKTLAPVREWSMGRDEQIEYAHKHQIPISQSLKKIYSYDENLWGDSAEGGEIEELDQIPKFDDILIQCTPPQKAPDKAEMIELEFVEGIPVAIDGEKMDLVKLIQTCNELGAKHGVGILPLIEDRVVGLKVRGVYEEPGAEIIIQAHRNLEKLVCTREENAFKRMVDEKWAYMVYGAQWYHPLMYHFKAYLDSVNKKVTGKVKVELYKGKAVVMACTSPYSLFDSKMATFMKSDLFNQNASPGFIELWNLPQKTGYNAAKNLWEPDKARSPMKLFGEDGLLEPHEQVTL